MEFPVYRKYNNGQSLFKIESETLFIELKKLGNRWEQYEFQASIFPDRQLISDMIEKRHGHWIDSSEEEFRDMQKQSPNSLPT